MEHIPVQLGASVYTLCVDHFSQAIEEIMPKFSGDLADPSVIEQLAEGNPRCAWCDAKERGRSFLSVIRNRTSHQPLESDSFLGT